MKNQLRICLAVLASATLLHARVTRIVIEQRESPAFNAQVFGKAGQYETLHGHFFGEIDPKDRHNKIVTDIQFAPKNARGMVEYSGTFAISKPMDMSKSNNVLLYSVVNRGSGATAGSADGQVSVVSGWQGDLQPRANLQTFTAPIARNADGSSLTGPVLARFINMPAGTNTLALTSAIGGLTYQRPVSLDTAKASLNKLASEGAKPVPVPGGEWAFADCSTTPFPGTPDPSKICVKNSFDPAFLYELVFTAKDPMVLGMGFAATRDLNSFLRYAEKDDAGTPNPVAKNIKWEISQGNSQSGNFIRSFIHLGFNEDEAGRIVWDGANPNIAGRQLAMNFRFAVAGGAANLDEPGSEAVLWWSDYPDPVRHRTTAGMLGRCRASKTCPKIFETFGGLEFWDLRMSLEPGRHRREGGYSAAGQCAPLLLPRHQPWGRTGWIQRRYSPRLPRAACSPPIANPESDTLRALMVDLTDWVTKGTEPPPSQYPRLDQGRAREAGPAPPWDFRIFRVFPHRMASLTPLPDYDFGPTFNYNDLSGVISIEAAPDQAGDPHCWFRKWTPTAPMWEACRRSCGKRR